LSSKERGRTVCRGRVGGEGERERRLEMWGREEKTGKFINQETIELRGEGLRHTPPERRKYQSNVERRKGTFKNLKERTQSWTPPNRFIQKGMSERYVTCEYSPSQGGEDRGNNRSVEV